MSLCNDSLMFKEASGPVQWSYVFLPPLESACFLLPGSKATPVLNSLLSGLKWKTQEFKDVCQCLANCVGLSLGHVTMSGR